METGELLNIPRRVKDITLLALLLLWVAASINETVGHGGRGEDGMLSNEIQDGFLKPLNVNDSFKETEVERDEGSMCDFAGVTGDKHAQGRRKVRLITYIGVEGTGHNLLQRMVNSLADTVFTVRSATKLHKIMGTRFSKYGGGKGGSHVPTELITSLDNASLEMDSIIDDNPNSTTFAFADWSNPFSRLPYSGVDPIDMVELSQGSRHDVSLSMIILHRNWTKIIWSTALRRGFASVAGKVNELYTSAVVLNAQLGRIPLCSWRTFDIGNYEEHPDEYDSSLARVFLVDVSRVKAFMKDSRDRFVDNKLSKGGANISKYDTKWTADDLLYVRNAFERPMVTKLWGRLVEPQYSLLASFDEVNCNCT